MRMSGWVLVPIGALVFLAAGCNCSAHLSGGPCDVEPKPAECMQSCDADTACAAGYYCHSSGVCTADCNDAVACAGGASCVDGRCVGGGEADGGDRDVRTSCADVTVEATRVTPNVILVVDQSSSMTAGFGDSNRWDELRDSLLDEPGGLVYDLQGAVRFGLALYSAEGEGNTSEPVPGECPMITWVDPAIENYDAIQAVYGPADVIDETPTGESLDWVLDRILNAPDPSPDPTIIILATDGEPDTCEQPNPQEGQPESLAAARRGYDAGIRTFIISVGEGTVSDEHLQDMANAGLGVDAGEPDAEYWVAGDDAGLRDALREIVGGEINCVVTLEGRIDDLEQACTGRVTLNGNDLACDDPNGWRVIDETHIELVGEACDVLQSGPGVQLTATFPCGVILI